MFPRSSFSSVGGGAGLTCGIPKFANPTKPEKTRTQKNTIFKKIFILAAP
jgi:hypothetical protein